MCYVLTSFFIFVVGRTDKLVMSSLEKWLLANSCFFVRFFYVILVINISFILIVLQYTALISYTCILNFIHSASEMSHREGDPVVEVGVPFLQPGQQCLQ